MREAVTPFLTRLNPNNNFIIVAKQSIDGQKLKDIYNDLERTLKKEGLID